MVLSPGWTILDGYPTTFDGSWGRGPSVDKDQTVTAAAPCRTMAEAAHICQLATSILHGHFTHPQYHRIGLPGIQVSSSCSRPKQTPSAAHHVHVCVTPVDQVFVCAHPGCRGSADNSAGLLWLQLPRGPLPGSCGCHAGEEPCGPCCQAATAAMHW